MCIRDSDYNEFEKVLLGIAWHIHSSRGKKAVASGQQVRAGGLAWWRGKRRGSRVLACALACASHRCRGCFFAPLPSAPNLPYLALIPSFPPSPSSLPRIGNTATTNALPRHGHVTRQAGGAV